MVPEARLKHSMHSTLPQDQQALYADGTWQVCNCSEPAGTASEVDAAIRNTARDLYWTTKCSKANIEALPAPVKQLWCSPGPRYGAWQRMGPLSNGTPTVRQLQIRLQILKMLQVFLASPEYANSSIKDFADAWRGLQEKVGDALT
jgi:hypothetical protein